MFRLNFSYVQQIIAFKVGRLIDAEQQLCLVHGIQLAVVSVLYENKKQRKQQEQKDARRQSTLPSSSDDSEEYIPSSSDDSTEDEYTSAEEDDTSTTQSELSVELAHPSIHELIKKIRQVVKIFKKSPTKNDDVLQKYIKSDFATEMACKLDCKTRWNSLLNIIEVFYKIRIPIKKALIDIRSEIQFSEIEFKMLAELIDSLLPIKLAVEAICRRDANLITADAAINFMLQTIESKSSEDVSGIKVLLIEALNKTTINKYQGSHYLHEVPFKNWF